MHYESAFFNSDGTTKEGFRLCVDDVEVTADTGKTSKAALCFYGKIDGKDVRIGDFGIAAYGTCRPGDDFRLAFGIAGEVPKNIGAEYNYAVASDGEFVAVYDKKLLWRANLYVDERREENGNWKIGTGTKQANIILGNRAADCSWDLFTSAEKKLLDDLDWNGQNPWTYAQGNDWDTRNERNGKQIEIMPWTRPYKQDSVCFNNSSTVVRNAVAYNWGGMDSPGDFNLDMLDQADALTASGQSASRNNPSLAPDNNWRNYILIDGRSRNSGATTVSIGTGTNQYQPYRPVLCGVENRASDWFMEDLGINNVNNGYDSFRTCYAAGADCFGMIQRAASYDGTIYKYGSDLRSTGGYNYNVEARLLWGKPFLFKAVPVPACTWDIDNTRYLIPGDIIVTPGHITMVQRITYLSDRTTNKALIIVVEDMTSPLSEWCARNDRIVNDIYGSVSQTEYYRLSVVGN